MIKKTVLAVAAASLAAAPVAAQATIERSAPAAQGENELGFGNPLFLILAAAAAVGIYLLVDDGDDDPISA